MTAPRPSVHDPITKSYAIDQITDIERLRKVTHRMWEAFLAAHSQAAHIIAATILDECDRCLVSLTEAGAEPCEEWHAWQRLVTAGFGDPI